jgi:hypothetical protein
MAATSYNPYIEQGAAWSRSIATDLDYTSLLGRAFISKCDYVFAAPTVTVPARLGEKIALTLTPAQTLAIPACGRTAAELESYEYLVELYDPADATRVYRLENGVARVSPRIHVGPAPTPPSPPPIIPAHIGVGAVTGAGVVVFPPGFDVVRVVVTGGVLAGIDSTNFGDGAPFRILVDSSPTNLVTIESMAVLPGTARPFITPARPGSDQSVTLTEPATIDGFYDLAKLAFQILTITQ